MESSTICPVCTLFLRPGITLKNHLGTHPKQKVIDALVKVTGTEISEDNGSFEPELICPSTSSQSLNTSSNPTWNVQGVPQILPPIQGNHVFIYQQSMSTSQTNATSLNPLAQQYIIPAVVNPQMMPPYVYQQQQLIMSSGSCNLPQMRFSPFELTCPPALGATGAQLCPTNAATVKTMIIEEIDSINEQIKDDITIEEHQVISEIPEDKEVDKQELTEDGVVIGVFNESGICPGDKNVGDVSLSGEETWNVSTSETSEELSKACQTPSTSSSLGCRTSENAENYEKKEEYYYFSNESENAINYSSDVQMETLYEQEQTLSSDVGGATVDVYRHGADNLLQSGERLDYVEVDGVQVIIGNYAGTQGGDKVVDNMTVEGAIVDNEREVGEEHVDIQADETMPPRGELSGQESMGGASEINWVRLQYNEGSSSASCASLSKTAWDDSSDIDHDLSSLSSQHVTVEAPSTPVVQSTSSNYACAKCDESFPNLLQLREHATDKHPKITVEQQQQRPLRQEVPITPEVNDKPKTNVIGSQIGKKKVKKLVVKLKKEGEAVNYDTVFTNKIKMEGGQGGAVKDEECKMEGKEEVGENNGDQRTVCSLCNEVLADAKSLRQHKAEVHRFATPQLRFKCATCDETFPNEYKYTDHLKVHPLECKLCGKLFYRRQNIQLHMKRHLGIRPFKCDVCEKAFSTKQKLEEHRNIHTGNAPLKCAFCDETFKRHSNLVAHRHRHHLKTKKQVKDYVCHCGEYFHSRKKLAWHKEVHDAKPKSCTKCSEKFVHLASLTRHIRKAHNERYLPDGDGRSTDNVECPVCKGVFIKSSLELHMRTHSGSRPYSCLICNKDFTTRWNLKLHKWTHASRLSKPFRCDQCNGAFVRETDYVSHMNSHKSIKPYTCNHCGARFIRKYNCQRHVKEHENDKKFSCTVCSKTFHRSYYLQDHMRIHSGVRPFTCHVCGKSSTTKSNHNKHIQIHHAREPVNTEN